MTDSAPVRPPRLRRLRRTASLRALVAETDLPSSRLIEPVFLRASDGPPEPIASIPGVLRVASSDAARLAEEARLLGLAAVLLFGQPTDKDARGSAAWAEDGAVASAIRAVKAHAPDMPVITDVCLCAYTTHGHCGVLNDQGEVDNDATLPLLARTAVAHARAGADIVAPSAMMDHQVRALREALDEAGFSATGILGYSAKFASAFYRPFRDAVDSTPDRGDRRGYQMDPGNAREALREIAQDIAEGADLVMVKPALPYLDILARARAEIAVPLVAYQVSGEFAMLKAAAERGWLDERLAVRESLTAIRRAGADLVVSYYAPAVARWERGRP